MDTNMLCGAIYPLTLVYTFDSNAFACLFSKSLRFFSDVFQERLGPNREEHLELFIRRSS